MRENTADNWVLVMTEDLKKSAYQWAETLGQALNGGNTGQLDIVIEQLLANSILPETTAENAAEQIARLVKWRIKLLKVGMVTTQLVGAIMAIAQGLDGLTLRVAESQFAEYIELDYLPNNPESMAGDRFEPKPDTKRGFEEYGDKSDSRPRF